MTHFEIAVMASRNDKKGNITLQISWNDELAYQCWSVVGYNNITDVRFCHFFDTEKDAIETYNQEYNSIWGK